MKIVFVKKQIWKSVHISSSMTKAEYDDKDIILLKFKYFDR